MIGESTCKNGTSLKKQHKSNHGDNQDAFGLSKKKGIVFAVLRVMAIALTAGFLQGLLLARYSCDFGFIVFTQM